MFQHVDDVLKVPEVAGSVKCLFLVGGFAESALLQEAFRTKLNELKIPPPIIPQVYHSVIHKQCNCRLFGNIWQPK